MPLGLQFCRSPLESRLSEGLFLHSSDTHLTDGFLDLFQSGRPVKFLSWVLWNSVKCSIVDRGWSVREIAEVIPPSLVDALFVLEECGTIC